MTPGGGWRVERSTGSAADFHGREPPDPIARAVWVLDVDRPALVVGSAQRASVVDAAAAERAGVEIVRRRSGGGAVLLRPREALWIDVLLPRGDPLWHDDIGISAEWLGDVWAVALGGDAHVHRGPMARTAWSTLVCFAGLGPGEVTAGAGGPKLVGISQRRTRAGARFQCVALSRWDAVGILDLLACSATERADAAAAIVHVAGGVEVDGLSEAFLLSLPG